MAMRNAPEGVRHGRLRLHLREQSTGGSRISMTGGEARAGAAGGRGGNAELQQRPRRQGLGC